MSASDYGRWYWSIETTDATIMIHADRVDIGPGGTLRAVRIMNDDQEQALLAIGAGHWVRFYAASQIDGGAVAVEHWDAKQKSKKPRNPRPRDAEDVP